MKQEMEEELVSNILPFWINRMTDEVNGGFYGRITGREEVKPEAEKGAILNARILWTFSAAYRLLKRPEYLETATRAKRTLIDRFYDNEFGGVYWSLDYKGNPLDTKKQIYALGFAIYGLSEYARATGDDEALAYAIRLFETIEEHSFDPVKNGYCEALTREWGWWLMMIFQVLISICTGIVSPLIWSMYADVADYAEQKDGTSSTGLIFSSGSMAQKFGGAFAGWAVMALLAFFGYNTAENAVQTPEALDGLKYLMSFIPAAIAALSIVVVFIYPLNKTRMAAINADLKERRENL